MSEQLVASLSQRDADIERLAQNFAQEFFNNPSDLYVQLGNLISYCCKIPSIPSRMFRNGDLIAVDIFLRQLFKSSSSNSSNSTVDGLLSLKIWPNVLTFFHDLIHSEWDLLSGTSNFNSFFAKFLSVLTNAELPMLRFFGVAIQLEFVSVIVSHKIELLRDNRKTTILKYVNNILLNSFHDCERKIWTHCLLQMRLWFSRHALLFDDEILRFLVWSLRDRTTINLNLGLEISSELLRGQPQSLSLNSFVKSLMRSLTLALTTEDLNLFEKICECANVLFHKYQNLCHSFMDSLFQYIFVSRRAKAKIVASVFICTKLQPLPPYEQMRQIVQFLAHQNSIFVELFVDAIIDDYQLLKDWDVLAEILKELNDIHEQETLLLIILCVASLVIDGTKPFIRDHKTEIHPEGNVTVAMASAFTFLLDSISNEELSFRAKLFIVKLATYFDLNQVQETQMASVLKEYLKMFQESTTIFDITQTSIMLELVFLILQHSHKYLNLIDDLASLFAKEFEKLARQLRPSTPEDYIASMNIVIGMYALRTFVYLDEKCLFHVPLILLQEEPQTDNIFLSLCHEIAVLFCCEYVLECLSKPDLFNDVEPNVDKVENMKLIFTLLEDCLSLYYLSRLGQLAFFASYRLAKALFAANVSSLHRNSIFTDGMKQCLCAYVSSTLRCVQPTEISLTNWEFSTYSMEKIIVHFSHLIVLDILPLDSAYILLKAYTCQTCKFEKEFRQFLLDILEQRPASEIAQWLFGYFAGYFAIDTKGLLDDLLGQAKFLSLLVQSIRGSMLNVMKHVHKMGIDFAMRPASTNIRCLPSKKFLLILAELSPCLNAKIKEECWGYFRRKQTVGDVNVVRLYANSLRVTKKRPLNDFPESSSDEEVDNPGSSPDSTRPHISTGESRPLFDESSSGLEIVPVRSPSMPTDASTSEKRKRIDEESIE